MRIAIVLIVVGLVLLAGCFVGGIAALTLFPSGLHDLAISADLKAQIEGDDAVRRVVGTASGMTVDIVESHYFDDPDTWVYELAGSNGVATVIIRSETTNDGERIDWAVLRGAGRSWIPVRGAPPMQEIGWAYGDEMSADVELDLAGRLVAAGLPSGATLRLDLAGSDAIDDVDTFVFDVDGAPAGTRLTVRFTPAHEYESSEDAPWIAAARLERPDGTSVRLIPEGGDE